MAWKESRKTVCVDFDGVLNNYKGYIKDHTHPVTEEGAAFLRKLKKTGFEVVILTSARLGDVERVLHDAYLDDVVDHITNVKVPAIAYIDDRAIAFRGDFDQTYQELMNFKTWWEDENHIENHGLSEKSE